MTTRAVMILRHGKSDWAAGHGGDMIRPLARRGSASAAAVGRFLATIGHVPDLVLCSPATRARQTANTARKAGAWPCPVETRGALYPGIPAQVFELLRAQPDPVEVVMVVGHEPGCSELIADLTGGGRHRMPTAALARVEFEVDRWEQITPGAGRLEWLIPSRVLLAAET